MSVIARKGIFHRSQQLLSKVINEFHYTLPARSDRRCWSEEDGTSPCLDARTETGFWVPSSGRRADAGSCDEPRRRCSRSCCLRFFPPLKATTTHHRGSRDDHRIPLQSDLSAPLIVKGCIVPLETTLVSPNDEIVKPRRGSESKRASLLTVVKLAALLPRLPQLSLFLLETVTHVHPGLRPCSI